MPVLLVHHALKGTWRATALCGKQLLLPTNFVPGTRRFYGDKSKAEAENSARVAKKDTSSNLTFLANVHFQGFPSLEGIRPKQERQDDRRSDFQTAGRAQGSSSRLEALKDGAEVTQDDRKDSVSPLVACGDVSTTLPKKSSRNSYNARYAGLFNKRLTLRPLAKPKRFRPLVQEARRSGAISRRGHRNRRTGAVETPLRRGGLSTEVLDAELRWVGRTSPAPRPVRNILKILIEERKINPTPGHYEALILGQCFPEFGSIENVKAILEEMEREAIPLEAPVLLAALTVLSVHPDTYLRCNILERLAAQQFSLPNTYAHLNILAIIREGQLEIATVELEKLSHKNEGTPLPNWLWTIYLHAICDLRQDFDAILQLMYRLSDSGFLFPRPTLLHLLEKASAAGDIDVTKFIWYGYVEAMHIIPNEDLCLSVLRVASKKEDVNLAESVAVVLESVAGNQTTDPPMLVDQGNPTQRRTSRLSFASTGSQEQEGSSAQSPAHTAVAEDSVDPAADSAVPTVPDAIPKIRFYSLADDTSFSGENPPWPVSRTISIPSEPKSKSKPQPEQVFPDLALAEKVSTPPSLPNQRPPPRPLPAEALKLLTELGITDFGPDADPSTRRGKRSVRAILYPFFREEAGLASARFDPRLALMKGWDSRKQ